MSEQQTILLASVALYMILMLLIGFWARRKIQSTKDYIIAGGKMGWGLSIGTIFATWFGAETCMGSSRTASEEGILGVIADPFGAALCLIFAGLFFVKFFHKMKIETIVDFFHKRYGSRVAGLLGVLYIPVYLGWIGGQLLAFGIILHALTGIPELSAILIATAVVLTYTYTGGMWAVAVTDFYQMLFILLGLLVLFPVLLADMGGFEAARAGIPEEFFHFYPRKATPLNWLHYVQAWMMVGIGSLPAQDLFQRLMAPKTVTIARWGAIIAGLMYALFGLIPVLLGIFSRTALGEGGSGPVLVDLALKYLPLPLMALMIGALLSAIMSSADSALLAPAGIIGHNLLPYFKPDADESLKLQWCRNSIWMVGGLSLILALYFQNIYLLCTHAWGFLLVGVAAPMIAGVYWKRANAAGALAGAICGTSSWIVFILFLPEEYPSYLMAFGVSCISLIAASLLGRENPEPSVGVPEMEKDAEIEKELVADGV
jgi:SSS family transporter